MVYNIKKFLVFLIMVVLLTNFLVMLWNKFQNVQWKYKPMIIYWPQPDKNLECYIYTDNDALMSVEDVSFMPKLKSIFFHETSCRGGVDSRQACAVESAARANPDWEVYLLFNAPVSDAMLKKSCLVKLLQYSNVRLARIHAASFSKGSAVQQIVRSKLLHSRHPVTHSADIMRMLTLHRWGGVYLDLDMLVVKSFDSLPQNWIAKSSPFDLATGAMRLSKDEVGQNWTEEIIHEILSTYDNTQWSGYGARATERVLRRRCPELHNATSGDCQGLSIYSSELFYPIGFSEAHLLVRGGPLKKINVEPYTYHIWNLVTKMFTIRPNSAYVQLASKLCPLIYGAYGDAFGV
ncbi:lactosylceramide 4-alpha-galactosyltransferase-like [Helicoverpa armigera]|uniref:lactosylceramide 4-alpha-galactosyltransferase-like n=1 Tax=Helicoverpa armigera TaxID=29058 RepID=UPI003082BFD9